MLNAVFPDNVDEITVHGLTQWDKGQQLKITLSSLPASFEVHFANKREKEAYVVEGTASNGVGTIKIPNILLTKPADAIAWIFETDGEEIGETVATIQLPMKKRAKPSDYVYTESELKIVNYQELSDRLDSVEEEVDTISLGIHDDGLVYVFINGKPVGDGMNFSSGSVVRFGQIVVSMEELSIREGGSTTFNVTLSKAPSEPQTVYLAVADNALLSVEPSTLTFTSDNWGTPQTITVTALQDENMVDEETSVALTSNGSEKIILVTISDDDKVELATDGLVLHMNYSGLTDYAEDTIVDPISGMTFKNFSQFTKLEKGISGETTYKYLQAVADDKKTAFLENIKKTGGFAVEIFGTGIPPCFFMPHYRTLIGLGAAYAIGIGNNMGHSVATTPTRILQDESVDYSAIEYTGTWTVDGASKAITQTAFPYKDDFRHVVITFSSSGEVNYYLNGIKCDSPKIVENFKSWDFDTMFGGDLSLINNTKNDTNFTSNQRIYNRVLTDAEVINNMKVNAMSLELTTF